MKLLTDCDTTGGSERLEYYYSEFYYTHKDIKICIVMVDPTKTFWCIIPVKHQHFQTIADEIPTCVAHFFAS